jgi:hypothetical protein
LPARCARSLQASASSSDDERVMPDGRQRHEEMMIPEVRGPRGSSEQSERFAPRAGALGGYGRPATYFLVSKCAPIDGGCRRLPRVVGIAHCSRCLTADDDRVLSRLWGLVGDWWGPRPLAPRPPRLLPTDVGPTHTRTPRRVSPCTPTRCRLWVVAQPPGTPAGRQGRGEDAPTSAVDSSRAPSRPTPFKARS